MHQRRLGDSDLDVSAIALGSWLTYSGGVGRARTEACTRAAFDAGITFFDTANVYGRGAAERAWGEILADYPRDSFAIAASRARRSTSRSTARWSAWGWTTSTSTSVIATTSRRRSRRRCRR
jgi:aryl-alcohol dehydrogenase-like predicted oxidoreductase